MSTIADWQNISVVLLLSLTTGIPITHSNPLYFLIDDDLDDQEIFLLVLSEMDKSLQCVTANDGVHALQIVRKEDFSPDFIFLDLNMPQMAGKECLVELRKMKKLDKVPIYIYSTSSSEKDKTETFEMGATGFITKTNSAEQLRGILSELLITN